MSAQFGFLRITELRRLLHDEEKCNRIIRYSEKFQRLKSAIENILVSNHRLAKGSLFHKPAFRDAKMLLAMKYKELEKLRGNIKAKQSYLDEKYIGLLHMAQLSLVKNILSAEQESEALLQRFVDGETPVGDFLEGFQHLRKLYHVRLVLGNVIRDTYIAKLTPGRPAGVGPSNTTRFFPSPAEPLSHPCCDRFRSLTPVLILPAIGRSLASLPVVCPPSGAVARRENPPRQPVGSYWVHHHHHHHHHHQHQHQHQQRPRCPRRSRKPIRLQKPQIQPGRRGPGPD